jgi:hypothetical protein
MHAAATSTTCTSIIITGMYNIIYSIAELS